MALVLASVAQPALAKQPASAKQKTDFEALRYQLPASQIAAKLSLTLEDCTTVPLVSGEAQLAAQAGAAADTFVLRTSQLESARIKRTLNISLHDTGTIATINSATEDRTGAILGNIVKFVANIAGAVFGLNVPGGFASLNTATAQCNDTAVAALARVRNIERLIGQLRTNAPPSNPKLAGEQSKAIDQLAQERAALRVGVLHLDLSAPLDLAKLAAAPVDAAHPQPSWTAIAAVKTDALKKAWLKDAETAPTIQAAWTVTLPKEKAPRVAGQQPSDECRAAVTDKAYPAICFVTPLNASFAATLSSPTLLTRSGLMSISADESLPVPQWGTLQYLPLTAGFGSNRDMSLTLDRFGRTSEMKWTSQARAETVTAGLAGLASQANALVAANSELARQKSEIEDLNTQQQLNKLRACREVLEVGGYTCPE